METRVILRAGAYRFNNNVKVNGDRRRISAGFLLMAVAAFVAIREASARASGIGSSVIKAKFAVLCADVECLTAVV